MLFWKLRALKINSKFCLSHYFKTLHNFGSEVIVPYRSDWGLDIGHCKVSVCIFSWKLLGGLMSLFVSCVLLRYTVKRFNMAVKLFVLFLLLRRRIIRECRQLTFQILQFVRMRFSLFGQWFQNFNNCWYRNTFHRHCQITTII